LQAEYKSHEPEQLERQRQERIERPKKVFDAMIGQVKGASLFESHGQTTGKAAGEVISSILEQLKSAQPAFIINRCELTPPTEPFRVEATQPFSGGSRHCVVVVGQSKDDEARIFFTVVEYKKASLLEQPLTSLVGSTPMEYNLINPNDAQLSDKSRNQIAEGISLLTAIVQTAIGQPPPVATPPATP
jgi:hypothetical protein